MSHVTLQEEVVELNIEAPQPLELVLSLSESLQADSAEAQLLTPWLAWVQPTFPHIWTSFVQALQKSHPWFMAVESVPELSMSVVLLNDADMQALNHQYRNKDSSTDVLTFSLLLEGQWQADTEIAHNNDATDTLTNIPAWQSLQLPGMPSDHPLELGEVYLSLSWVLAHATAEAQASSPQAGQSLQAWRFYYLTERLIHGFLHLLGVHHDTLSDYNKVVAIQQQVLSDAFRVRPPTDD